MCGGGGGGQVDDGSFQANIDRDKRQREIDRVRQIEIDQQAAKDKAAADSKAELTRWSTEVAPQVGAAYLGRRGITDTDNALQQIINSIVNKVPAGDPNPASYFTDDAFAAGFSDYENQGRQRFGSQVNSTFAPGFERALLPDASVDPFIASIMGQQRGAANQSLDFNKKRGLLNDVGYNTALTELGSQEQAGRSTLRGIADSVLGKERQELLDIRGDAGNAASGWNYGNAAPDIGGYFGRAKSNASTSLADLEGSVRGAVGGTNFFDVPTALQKGGTMQGPINLVGEGAVGPDGAPRKKPERTLATGGVF